MGRLVAKTAMKTSRAAHKQGIPVRPDNLYNTIYWSMTPGA